MVWYNNDKTLMINLKNLNSYRFYKKFNGKYKDMGVFFPPMQIYEDCLFINGIELFNNEAREVFKLLKDNKL